MGIEELLLDMAEKRGVKIGREEQREEGNYRFVAYLSRNTDFDDEKIASTVEVNIAFVEKVKKRNRALRRVLANMKYITI